MKENKEIWRPIKEWEGLYEVSNLGNVKNINNNKILKTNIIKPNKNGNYKQVIINILHKTFLLHRLVAQAFPEICGDWFDGCEVHHIDFNPLNNCAINLRICTTKEHHKFHSGINNPRLGKHRSDETKERISKALKGKYVGAKHFMYGQHRSETTKRKLKEKHSIPIYQLDKDGNILQKWESALEASKQLGISNCHICSCCRGKRLTTGGYRCAYANPEDNHS